MSEASQYFSQIKQQFQNAGIRSEVRIAEHVAALLLVKYAWKDLREFQHDWRNLEYITDLEYKKDYDYGSLPELPQFGEWIPRIIKLLEDAIQSSTYDNLGKFFQHEIRPEFLKSSRNDQYPTPNHIAEFMAELVVNSDTTSIIDPTVGTGGLLAAAHQIAKNARLVGYDFDPQWVGMGYANLQLHGVNDFLIAPQQSLKLYDDYHEDELFQSVLMNPSFGDKRSAFESNNIRGGSFGSKGETLLAALALNLLDEGGHATFLQPSGSLFGSGGEARLRYVVTEEYRLHAIIALPPDSMQPYSSIGSNLFVAQRADAVDKTWFLQLTGDGYDGKANRDLTIPPKLEQSDLGRARDLILAHRMHTAPEIEQVWTQVLGDELPGVAFVYQPVDGENFEWDVTYLGALEGILVKVRSASHLLGWILHDFRNREVIVDARSDIKTVNWTELVSQTTWSNDMPSDWQGLDDNVTLKFDTTEKSITLSQGKTEYAFNEGQEMSIPTIILDASGKPISDWVYLSSSTKNETKLKDNKFATDTGATAIYSATEERIGWLLDLSDKDDDSDATATLLIMNFNNADLFDVNAEGAVAFLENGYLIAKQDRIMLKSGKSVRLRDDIINYGFAIGPAPYDPTIHSLFGILVHKDDFIDDMRPSRFLPEPESVPLDVPMNILAKIRKGQTKLSSRVDTLLGVLGHPIARIDEANNVSPVPDWITNMLNPRQKDFLDTIVSQNVNDKPTHFTIEQALKWDDVDSSDSDFVQQQIELFLRMGLIQAVHTSDYNYYRLTTVGDLTKKQETS